VKRLISVAIAIFGPFAAISADAQRLGYGNFPLVLPLAAETPSYVSTIYVHNPGTATVIIT
jgi:hypothetical protein